MSFSLIDNDGHSVDVNIYLKCGPTGTLLEPIHDVDTLSHQRGNYIVEVI